MPGFAVREKLTVKLEVVVAIRPIVVGLGERIKSLRPPVSCSLKSIVCPGLLVILKVEVADEVKKFEPLATARTVTTPVELPQVI